MGNEINRDSVVYFDNGVPLADGSTSPSVIADERVTFTRLSTSGLHSSKEESHRVRSVRPLALIFLTTQRSRRSPRRVLFPFLLPFCVVFFFFSTTLLARDLAVSLVARNFLARSRDPTMAVVARGVKKGERDSVDFLSFVINDTARGNLLVSFVLR